MFIHGLMAPWPERIGLLAETGARCYLDFQCLETRNFCDHLLDLLDQFRFLSSAAANPKFPFLLTLRFF